MSETEENVKEEVKQTPIVRENSGTKNVTISFSCGKGKLDLFLPDKMSRVLMPGKSVTVALTPNQIQDLVKRYKDEKRVKISTGGKA